jgi:hypothetical protein
VSFIPGWTPKGRATASVTALSLSLAVLPYASVEAVLMSSRLQRRAFSRGGVVSVISSTTSGGGLP